jgi:hypothetical protein
MVTNVFELANYSLTLIFLVSLGLLLGAAELGHRLGQRAGEGGSGSVATLEASILGLLALMISFTFAMALSRFDTRRDAVLKEANAIGTTALRARLLPPPHNTETLDLLRQYVKIRLDITRRAPSQSELDAAISQSIDVQEKLWQQAKAAAAKDPGIIPVGFYIQSLNDVIDNHENRVTAGRNRVPNIVLLALYGIACVAITFTGYAAGLETRRWRAGVYVTSAVAAAVILLIQDLDRPGSGFIVVSQQPMIDVAESLAGYTD